MTNTIIPDWISPFLSFLTIYGSYHFFKFAATEKIIIKNPVTIYHRIFGHIQVIFYTLCVAFAITIFTDYKAEGHLIDFKYFVIIWIPGAIGIESAIAKYNDHRIASNKRENELDEMLKQNNEDREKLKREMEMRR